MPRPWLEPQNVNVPHELEEAVNGNTILSQTLYRRGLRNIQSIKGFLDPLCYQAASPWDLPDMDIAVSLLDGAIKNGQRICVWGDFDVDGQTATTVLVTALHRLGADVIHHIPVRAQESHGISVDILSEFISQGINLLLTCDTGTSANLAVHLARQHNLFVIVTDHHDLPATLPDAHALINPKRLPHDHPLNTLPGVGVAYKLAEALYQFHGITDASVELLDLVVLGIVADLAYLQADTRYLVQIGLPALRQMHRLGLKILSELAELNPQNITEDHISFVLAPRLNALGRLSNANSIVEFLTTDDPLRARVLAYELEGLNANRRLLSDQVYRAAVALLENDSTLLQYNTIVLNHPTWPAGVIGIVAARLVERFGKPVILFSSPPGEFARGSARSIEGINITNAIATQAHLLDGYGGHPMAAGLSIQPDRIPVFRRELSRAILDLTGDNRPMASLVIDGFQDLNGLSLDLVTDIERLAPFGTGNPPVILASRGVSLAGYTAVGKHGEHLLMTIEDELGYKQQAIWWQGADQSLPEGKFDLAYTVRAATYRGQKDVQLEWIDFRPTATQSISPLSSKQPITVEDFRSETDPFSALARLRINNDLQLWCETEDRVTLHAQDRLSLLPCSRLVIWSAPPGQAILQQAILQASPLFIYLFANSTSMDQMDAFIKRLAGLCKYAIRHNKGETRISILAAATNQRLEAIKLGVNWLQTYGHFHIRAQEQDQLQITTGSGIVNHPDRSIIAGLHSLLAESAAYRKYYSQTDKDRLINPES